MMGPKRGVIDCDGDCSDGTIPVRGPDALRWRGHTLATALIVVKRSKTSGHFSPNVTKIFWRNSKGPRGLESGRDDLDFDWSQFDGCRGRIASEFGRDHGGKGRVISIEGGVTGTAVAVKSISLRSTPKSAAVISIEVSIRSASVAFAGTGGTCDARGYGLRDARCCCGYARRIFSDVTEIRVAMRSSDASASTSHTPVIALGVRRSQRRDVRCSLIGTLWDVRGESMSLPAEECRVTGRDVSSSPR